MYKLRRDGKVILFSFAWRAQNREQHPIQTHPAEQRGGFLSLARFSPFDIITII